MDENQVRHTFRHIDQLGLDRDAISNAIRADLARQGPVSPGANITGSVSVGGVRLEYRAFAVVDGTTTSGLEMSGWRKLRKEEAALVAALVRSSPRANEFLRSLSERLVEDMNDGGMCSLRFRTADNRKGRFGKKIAEAQFTDEDGTLVSAVVNQDESGELFEFDIWKVDFSPLKRYPRPEDLRIKPLGIG